MESAESSAESSRRRSFRTVALVILLMLVHVAIVGDALTRLTPTVDEIAHVPAGISYLQTGTFGMYRLSPPLGRLLPATASLAASPKTRYDRAWSRQNPANHWSFAFEFLLINADDPERYLRLFTCARWVVACWSSLAIPILFAWGSSWFGRLAGWLAATLWAIAPNMIAHASFATTDIPTTVMTLLAAWTFSRWLDQPSWRRALLAGGSLGLAQLIKFSTLLLYGAFALWALLDPLWNHDGKSSRWKTLWERRRPSLLVRSTAGWQMIAIYALSLFVLNAGYLFEGTFRPLGSFPFVSNSLTRERGIDDGPADQGSSMTYNEIHQRRVNRFRGTPLGWLPTPLPANYVGGFDEQKFEAGDNDIGRYQMYLRGQLRREGWWYYYLYALAVKLPLSSWALLALGLVAWGWPTTPRRSAWPLVLLAGVPIFAMTFLTDINIGVRYLLPIFPFLFLIAGGAASWSRPRWWNGLIAALVLANAVTLAMIHPSELAYFNALVGGPREGRFHLIDSNLDWGQDLRRLSAWIDEHPEWKDVRLAYFGTVPPEFEGIETYQLAPRDPRIVPAAARLPGETDEMVMGPQPGKYAVSVNFERGMSFHMPVPLVDLRTIVATNPRLLMSGSPLMRQPAEAYAYFQEFTPTIDPAIGYSILLYDISLEEANRVRRKMGLPELAE
ncbi:Dolichyl-phosphate-mannose-protein mannosyltransferase [Planctomycetes bacterium Pan216]|uniref:Dolichyl-phosphate-mannose-protein mannosyltransferase n=1 Tax=Kolteria novifilia TaxID=2527975 RepID=A0A518B1Y4_9BACT|nr:Dolichyl-phosphate-mannose-protein mannosyltransferase [Planctomycetes bacterium Pan216]